MSHFLCALLWGYGVSVGIGTVVAFLFHQFTNWLVNKDHPPKDAAEEDALRVTPSSIVTGVTERLVFTPFVIIAPVEAVTAMGGWLALKMAATWQRTPPSTVSQRAWISRAFVGLQAGLVSMALAAAGGMIGRHVIGFPIL